MVFGLWLPSLFDRQPLPGRSKFSRIMIVFIVTMIILGLISWQAGYWVSSSSPSEWGYGEFRFNLFSPLYPMGWSKFHLIPPVFQDFESFNYIGLGSLLIFMLGAYFSWGSRWVVANFICQHKFLVLVLCCFLFYAISNNVSVGRFIYTIPLPDQLAPFLNILRHSNRMFWPVFYALLAGSIYLIIQKIKNSTLLTLIFFTALSLQIFDTSVGWLWLRNSLMYPSAPEYGTPL